MQPLYSDQSFDDTYSQHPRSRAISEVSTPDGLLQGLQLSQSRTNTPSLDAASFTSSRPSPLASPQLPSSSYTSPHLSQIGAFPPAPHQNHSSFPVFSQGVLDHDWFGTERPQAQTQNTPWLRVESPPEHGNPASSPPLQSIESGTMSTVALPYDPTFTMGSKNSFTWPGTLREARYHLYQTGGSQQAVMDSQTGLLGSDLPPYTSDASLSPPGGSRGVSASPPRGTLSMEQRELKRQQDHARHTSKVHMRGRRSGSGSSVYSNPAALIDPSTGGPSMPIYTTAPPTHIPMMAEPPTSQYLPPFSPPLPDQSMFAPYSTPSYGVPQYYPPTSSQSLQDPYPSYPGPMMPMAQGQQDQVRVVQPRPKPQCWDHGCNGRQFSTFSNLLRHQREKSGQATKATCPNCGAEFTRTTARNGHMAHDKCKQKRNNN